MRKIDVKEQVRLGLVRLLKLTIIGIRYRLFRSLVTVVVIAVAVAFLMNVLSEGLLKGAVKRMASRRIAEERRATFWAARLSVPGALEEIIREAARSGSGGQERQEILRMGRLSSEDMESFRKGASTATRYMDFFEGVDYARRRILVHRASGVEIFDRLRNRDEFERMESELRGMRSLSLVTSTDELWAFLGQWPEVRRFATRVRDGRAEAISRIREHLAGRSVLQGLAEADGSFGQVIRDAGFALDEVTAGIVAAQAGRTLDTRLLEESSANPGVRRFLAAYLDIVPSQVNAIVLWRLLRNRGNAAWYLKRLAKENLDPGHLSAERVTELARAKVDEMALAMAERAAADVGGGLMGIGERMTWLCVVAMVVCVVGVTNAMLMSVTERFREIATLKCLGALDGSIMVLFVMEACLLGVVGGIVGATVGSLIGLGRMFAVFGSLQAAAFPLGQLVFAVLMSTGIGVVLAAIAAVYPSFRAARLAPMEAMRIQ